ncbi:hypothetical protein ACRRTK_022599 [Alexandromys fortis]
MHSDDDFAEESSLFLSEFYIDYVVYGNFQKSIQKPDLANMCMVQKPEERYKVLQVNVKELSKLSQEQTLEAPLRWLIPAKAQDLSWNPVRHLGDLKKSPSSTWGTELGSAKTSRHTEPKGQQPVLLPASAELTSHDNANRNCACGVEATELLGGLKHDKPIHWQVYVPEDTRAETVDSDCPHFTMKFNKIQKEQPETKSKRLPKKMMKAELFKQTFVTTLESDSFILTVRLRAEDSESHVLLTNVRRSTVCCGNIKIIGVHVTEASFYVVYGHLKTDPYDCMMVTHTKCMIERGGNFSIMSLESSGSSSILNNMLYFEDNGNIGKDVMENEYLRALRDVFNMEEGTIATSLDMLHQQKGRSEKPVIPFSIHMSCPYANLT